MYQAWPILSARYRTAAYRRRRSSKGHLSQVQQVRYLSLFALAMSTCRTRLMTCIRDYLEKSSPVGTPPGHQVKIISTTNSPHSHLISKPLIGCSLSVSVTTGIEEYHYRGHAAILSSGWRSIPSSIWPPTLGTKSKSISQPPLPPFDNPQPNPCGDRDCKGYTQAFLPSDSLIHLMSAAAAAVCRSPAPVPSRCLIRFLRLQNDAITSTTSGAVAVAGTQRSLCTRGFSPARRISLSCQRQGAIPLCKRPEPLSRRCFSTTNSVAKISQPDAAKEAHATTWQERLWGSMARRGAKPLQPDDLPSHENLENGSIFTSRRAMAAKAALEPRLRCTEVDENGKVILVDGEFKKTELIAKVCQLLSSAFQMVFR